MVKSYNLPGFLYPFLKFLKFICEMTYATLFKKLRFFGLWSIKKFCILKTLLLGRNGRNVLKWLICIWCFSLEDRFLATLSSQSSTSSPHLQLPTSPESVPEQAMGGPPELDTASSSEGTGQITISVLRPVETNTLSAGAQCFLSPWDLKFLPLKVLFRCSFLPYPFFSCTAWVSQ